jgi:hypothetical protein
MLPAVALNPKRKFYSVVFFGLFIMSKVALYVVHCEESPFGAQSVWTEYSDAYAAAGEQQAMDPENYYSVQEVTEEELCDFWWNNPHLEFGPVQAV